MATIALFFIFLYSFFTLCFSDGGESLSPLPSSATFISPPPPMLDRELHQAALLSPILANLGFQELAMAVPALFSPTSAAAAADVSGGPITLFAPSDDSIRSCGPACPAERLLREHLVPGLFPLSVISKLAFRTKLPTLAAATNSPVAGRRCLTLTSNSHLLNDQNATSTSSPLTKFFVDGVEITRPDLFNDGHVVIHGLQGYVTPLSPHSCEENDSPAPPPPQAHASFGLASGDRSSVNRLMMRDAIVRLRDAGFSILALAMRIKYPELVGLRNMTIFALDDAAIFAGGHAYVMNVRFHIIPNRLLMLADLAKLPQGTVMASLVRGQHLLITQAASDAAPAGLRINYVPIKAPEVVSNANIVIHSIFLPFPHLYLFDESVGSGSHEDGIFDEERTSAESARGWKGSCSASAAAGGKCSAVPSPAPVPVVDFEDDGL